MGIYNERNRSRDYGLGFAIGSSSADERGVTEQDIRLNHEILRRRHGDSIAESARQSVLSHKTIFDSFVPIFITKPSSRTYGDGNPNQEVEEWL